MFTLWNSHLFGDGLEKGSLISSGAENSSQSSTVKQWLRREIGIEASFLHNFRLWKSCFDFFESQKTVLY